MIFAKLFAAPAAFHAALLDGSAIQYGALIKDAATGRILAHVQETGLLQKALSEIGSGSFGPLGLVNTAMQAKTAVDMGRMMHMMQGLQGMAWANLGVGLAGIGVSVAGAALVLQRLNALRQDMNRIEKMVESGFRALEGLHYEEMFAAAQSALEHGRVLQEQASAHAQEWKDLAIRLREISTLGLIHVECLLAADRIQLDMLEKMLLASFICKSAEIQAMLQASEMQAAFGIARRSNEEYARIFHPINPADLLRKQGLMTMPNRTMEKIRQGISKTGDFLSALRQQTLAMQQRQLLLHSLNTRGVNGASDYLRILEQEKTEPLLLVRL